MLAWRLTISALLIPAFVGLFWWDSTYGDAAPVLLVLALILALRTGWELCDMLSARAMRPHFPRVGAACAALVLSAWSHLLSDSVAAGSLAALGVTAVVFAVAVLVLMLGAAFRYEAPGENVERLAAEILAVAYVGVLFAVTLQLRWIGPGYFALGSLVICTKLGDIGAYTIGRLFGKRKMAPKLSPGKTWAGFVGALIGGTLGSLLWFFAVPPLFDLPTSPLLPVVIYGLSLGLTGLIGDLCESLIKRDMSRKDAANLMPGFGGLLDLLDSILYAGPIAWLLWQVLIPA